jgi:branched-chain amino acid transport system permease protein
MFDAFGVSPQLLFGELTLGLVNGGFYAMLSLGLSVIFGMLDIVNFAHGVLYMLGAFAAWLLLTYFGIDYWGALLIGPAAVGLVGVALERLLLSHIRHLHHIYGFLLTFGLLLVIQGLMQLEYSVSGQHYAVPKLLQGTLDLGFMYVPIYRAWVLGVSLAVCFLVWGGIEKTRFGAQLRAGTHDRALAQALGINVPRLVTITFGLGTALAGLAGVLAAPMYPVNPLMGAEMIGIVFAVVIVGGLGSILGSIVAGVSLGLLQSLVKTFYPQAATLAIYVIMAGVLLVRAGGLSGKGRETQMQQKA